ncbi:MAG: DUF2207 domain-containing protein [Anaerolineae bacterium]|nr:DUF2207 domain-containing protein [Anaerolineae bacterium]
MDMKSIVRTGAALVFFLVFNIIIGAANFGEQETSSEWRKLQWDRYDVVIDNFDTTANRFDVTEIYRLSVSRGTFSYGYAEIPTDRTEGLADITISENGTAYTQSCYNRAGTFCVTHENDVTSIQYNFLNPFSDGQTRTIRLKYTVTGALRSYNAGDELFWAALPGDLSFPVMASRVDVILPDGVEPLLTTGYPEDTWQFVASGNRLTWISPPRPSDDGMFEVRVQYPHNSQMKKPDWQAGYDREQKYEDDYQPIVSLAILALTVLGTLGGGLFIVLNFLRTGRDPDTVVVPEYLTEPPSDEPPGLIGALLDEKADMEDVMATLIDLARRDYLVIEQTEGSSLSVFKSGGFEFHRTGKETTDLRGYEKALLHSLFPSSRDHTTMSDLKDKFYTHIPTIKRQMYADLVKVGHFPRSPETTRNIWLGIGVGGMIVASALFWGALQLTIVSPLLPILPVGLGIVCTVALLFATSMPAKTEHGAQQAALWRAFRRYLKDIDQQDEIEPATQSFERYLAYATAFGIDQGFMKRVSPALTSMPRWYYPTYLGGPWDGGYRRGSSYPHTSQLPHRPGSGAPGSGPSLGSPGGPGGLSGMDHSLGQGLNAMSGGLSRMLNSTSRAMSSRPSSSGSRGGGFSGGGRGGGSGGGSRGFG